MNEIFKNYNKIGSAIYYISNFAAYQDAEAEIKGTKVKEIRTRIKAVGDQQFEVEGREEGGVNDQST